MRSLFKYLRTRSLHSQYIPQISELFNKKRLPKISISILQEITNSSRTHGDAIQQSPIWVRGTIFGLMGSAFFGIVWLS